MYITHTESRQGAVGDIYQLQYQMFQTHDKYTCNTVHKLYSFLAMINVNVNYITDTLLTSHICTNGYKSG